jgi:gluconolactonase
MQMGFGRRGHCQLMPRSAPICLLLLLVLSCSSDEGSHDPAAAGGGSSGSGAGGGQTAMAGSAGQSVAGVTSGGATIAGNTGAGGTAGASAGQGGAAGASGAAGSGGSAGGGDKAGFWGPNGPKKQWTCPAGPFPAQQLGQSTNICAGFAYNYEYNEGPTWIASQNAFFFSNFKQGKSDGGDIIKYTLGGACEVWLHDVGCNGLAVSPSGNLLGACHGPRAVMEYDVATKQGRQVATTVDGKMLDSPNDLIARGDGNVYFSNTTYELGNRPVGLGFAAVRIDPIGKTSLIEAGNLNGIALSPDENELHVVGKGTWTLDAQGVPGPKGGPTPTGDGIAVDCAGNISNNGTNSAYGGPDGKTLLVVGGGTSARTVAVTVPGLP